MIGWCGGTPESGDVSARATVFGHAQPGYDSEITT